MASRGKATSTNTSQRIYEDIVRVICHDPGHELLEIEFLGKAHELAPGCPFLKDESSIAIPKAALVQVFVVARAVLFKNLKSFSDDKHLESRDAAAMLLLMDPEHLTATNVRKRVLQPFRNRSPAELSREIYKELRFIDSLLTSPLKRHTKSPTLWAHRRWLLEIFKATGLPHDVRRDYQSVILVSAQRHPRNYYAWSHIRWLLQTFGGRDNIWLHGKELQSPSLGPINHSELQSITIDWCLRNSSDISGLSFLLFYIFSRDSPAHAPCSAYDSVLRLTAAFHWNNESIWVFLRTLAASGKISEEQRAGFFQCLQSQTEALHEGSPGHKFLQASKSWVLEYGDDGT